jgi:ABC-type lipoprotein release transport system permease subunit
VNIYSTAWRNIWRNRRRSILSILAVAVSCALLIVSMALQRGSYSDMIRHTVQMHCGHVQIQHPDYREDRDLISCIEQPDRILQHMDKMPHIAGAAPRINAPVLLAGENSTFGAMLLGVDPGREPEVSTITNRLKKGTWLSAERPDGIILGEKLARNLNLKAGDDLVFIGQAMDGSTAAGRATVLDIFSFGVDELDRNAAAMNLSVIQEAFAMENKASAIAVLLENDRYRRDFTNSAASFLGPQETMLGWPELQPGVVQAIRMDWNSGLISYAILVLIVAFGIANTFLMAFMERIHEYGVLMSIGTRNRSLALMNMTESIMLTLTGIAAGVLIGIPVTLWFQTNGIRFSEEGHMAARYGMSPVIHPELSLPVILWAGCIVFVITALMALYPVRRILRLRPAEALRHQ